MFKIVAKYLEAFSVKESAVSDHIQTYFTVVVFLWKVFGR